MPLRFAPAVLLAAALFAAEIPSTPSAVVAHEWGTFTAVAGYDGSAVAWSPLDAGASDLPCFVHRLSAQGVKLSYATVRMETPVLYFYAAKPATLNVRVYFPHGVLTEWYPQVTSVQPRDYVTSLGGGRLEWDSLEVRPGDAPAFPSTKGASRYYAARETESAPLAIPLAAGGEREKLIFYRGVGNIQVPLQPRSIDERTVEIRNTGAAPIGAAVLFENRGGQIGYRVVRDLTEARTVAMPQPGASDVALRKELEGILVESGLYEKEARAMVETWRDSWFEEGARIFYIVPRAAVDEAVQLAVTPAPKEMTRVFVGRVEMLTPRTEWAIDAALASGDAATLEKYGRFLDAFVNQMQKQGKARTESPAAKALLHQMMLKVSAAYGGSNCVQ
jgi:hypothetical protein